MEKTTHYMRKTLRGHFVMDLAQKLVTYWALLLGSFVCDDCANICRMTALAFPRRHIQLFCIEYKVAFSKYVEPFTICSREYLSNKIYWRELTTKKISKRATKTIYFWSLHFLSSSAPFTGQTKLLFLFCLFFLNSLLVICCWRESKQMEKKHRQTN